MVVILLIVVVVLLLLIPGVAAGLGRLLAALGGCLLPLIGIVVVAVVLVWIASSGR